MGSCVSKKSSQSVAPLQAHSRTPSKSSMKEMGLENRSSGIGGGNLAPFVLSDNILNYYILKSAVGHGQFGSVKLAIHRTGNKKRKFAVKIIPKEKLKACFLPLQRELQYLKTADHPNVIRLYEVFEDQRNVNIVMDYLAGGELYDRLEKKAHFPEREACILMYKLFHAVSHLHFLGICHRDLKPENFLYDSNREDSEIKIIDFGLGNKFDVLNNEMHTVVGTPYYVAPEVLRKKYGKECDIWSLGVIMYAILVGFPPFNGASDQEIQRKVLKGDFSFKHIEWEPISKDAKELIKNLLNLDPQKRLPAAEVLNHSWFTQIQDVTRKPIDPVVTKRLKAFRSGGALRREALKVICQFVSNEEIRVLNAAFRVLDDEHIGFLSQQGMDRAVREAGQEPMTEEEIRTLFSEVELRNGRMSYTDFIITALNPAAYLGEPLDSGFKYFDSADKGFLTVDDVRKVFTKSGKQVMDDDIMQLIQVYDTNKDGKLDFEEFSAMIQGRTGTNKIQTDGKVR